MNYTCTFIYTCICKHTQEIDSDQISGNYINRGKAIQQNLNLEIEIPLIFLFSILLLNLNTC